MESRAKSSWWDMGSLKLSARLPTYTLMIGSSLLGSAVWIFLIGLRPVLIKPFCQVTPGRCQRDSLWLIDRLAVGLELPGADELSYVTQNLSGLIGILAPGVVLLFTPWLRTQMRAFGLSWWIRVIWFELLATLTNGCVAEATHLFSQRPRPFVLDSGIARHGLEIAHYTSFYSGHTSFTAVVWSALCLALFQTSGIKKAWPLSFAAFGFCFVFSTGYLRVVAGKHYVSDVLVGALVGFFLVLALDRLMRLIPNKI